MFMGQYEHSIDAKGRAIVTGKVSRGTGDVFYVTWADAACIYIHKDDWEELARKTAESAVQSAEPFDPETVNGITSELTLMGRVDTDSRKSFEQSARRWKRILSLLE